MSLLVLKLGEQRATACAYSSKQGQGMCGRSDSMGFHTLSKCASYQSPRMISNKRCSQGIVWMWPPVQSRGELESDQKFQQFIHGNMSRGRGESLACFTLWSRSSCSNHLSTVSWAGRNPLFTKKVKFREDHPSSTLVVYVMPSCTGSII